MLDGPRDTPRWFTVFVCLNYHTSQARSVFNNYCNFSSTLTANVFSFLCQLLFAFQMVMMIHNFDHGHYICAVHLLFPSFANADNNEAKRFVVVSESFSHYPIKSSSNKMPSRPGVFAYRTAVYQPRLLLRKWSLPFYSNQNHK